MLQHMCFFFSRHITARISRIFIGRLYHQELKLINWDDKSFPVMAVQKMTNVTPLYGKQDPYYS